MQVLKEETDKFSKIWTYKGVVIPLNDAHIQFATDWANVVLRNFIQMCQQQVQQAQQQAKPTVTLEG